MLYGTLQLYISDHTYLRVDIGIANWLQLYIVEFFARTTHSITEVGEFLILCLPVLSKGPKVTRV